MSQLHAPLAILAESDSPRSDPPAAPQQRKLSAIVAGFGSAAAMAALSAVGGATRPLLAIACWGILLLLSFVGWGSLLRRAFAPERAVDLGLRLVWGMALVTFLGGAMLALRVVSRATTIAMVVAGLAAACVEVSLVASRFKVDRTTRDIPLPERGWFAVMLALLAGLLVVLYCGSILDPSHWYGWDDAPAYFVFPKEMLEAGTSLQPFSVRRLQSWGAQSFFQALFVARVPEALLRPHVFDRGLCTIILTVMMLGSRPRRTDLARILVVLGIGALLMIPNNRENSTSELSGAVFFLALYRTLKWCGGSRPRWQHGVLLGLVVTAACAFRQNYCVVAVGTVALSYCFAAWSSRGRPGNLSRLSKECLATGVTTLALLFPWSLVAHQTFGAWFFPLTLGTFRATLSGISASPNAIARIKDYWANLTLAWPITTGPLLVLAGMLVWERALRRPFWSLFLASIVGFAAEIWLLALISPQGHGRYYFASEVAVVMAIALAAPRGQKRGGPLTERALPALLATFALILQMYSSRDETKAAYEALIDSMGTVLRQKAAPTNLVRSQVYDDVQAAVPPSATILAMVDEPYRFDFHRNPVLIVDFPGAVSPRPGMPVNGDAQALLDYLKQLAIRYLVFVKPSASAALYRKTDWEGHAAAPTLTEHKLLGPAFVGMMTEVETLESSRQVLFEGGNMVVLDLEAAKAVP